MKIESVALASSPAVAATVPGAACAGEDAPKTAGREAGATARLKSCPDTTRFDAQLLTSLCEFLAALQDVLRHP
jgi:hypothetical protein